MNICSINELPKEHKGLFIVNNEPSWLPGEHWIAVYNDELFDSYGFPPSFYNISNIHNYNKTQIQSYYSNKCWAYCIYYLLKRVDGMTLNNICKSLKYDDDKNVLKRLKLI